MLRQAIVSELEGHLPGGGGGGVWVEISDFSPSVVNYTITKGLTQAYQLPVKCN